METPKLDEGTAAMMRSLFSGNTAPEASIDQAQPVAGAAAKLDESTRNAVSSMLGVGKTITEALSGFAIEHPDGSIELTNDRKLWLSREAAEQDLRHRSVAGGPGSKYRLAKVVELEFTDVNETVEKTINYRGFVITIHSHATRFGVLFAATNNTGEPMMKNVAFRKEEEAVAFGKKLIDEYIAGTSESVNECVVQAWIDSKIQAALTANGIKDGGDRYIDAVYSAALAGKLGDGTPSDETAAAIDGVVKELAAAEVAPASNAVAIPTAAEPTPVASEPTSEEPAAAAEPPEIEPEERGEGEVPEGDFTAILAQLDGDDSAGQQGEDPIPGEGRAEKEGLTADDVDPEALAKGIEVEKEHTDDEEVAKSIALDHLAEDPQYYEKLAKMEQGVQAEAMRLGETVVIASSARAIRALFGNAFKQMEGEDTVVVKNHRLDAAKTMADDGWIAFKGDSPSFLPPVTWMRKHGLRAVLQSTTEGNTAITVSVIPKTEASDEPKALWPPQPANDQTMTFTYFVHDRDHGGGVIQISRSDVEHYLSPGVFRHAIQTVKGEHAAKQLLGKNSNALNATTKTTVKEPGSPFAISIVGRYKYPQYESTGSAQPKPGDMIFIESADEIAEARVIDVNGSTLDVDIAGVLTTIRADQILRMESADAAFAKLQEGGDVEKLLDEMVLQDARSINGSAQQDTMFASLFKDELTPEALQKLNDKELQQHWNMLIDFIYKSEPPLEHDNLPADVQKVYDALLNEIHRRAEEIKKKPGNSTNTAHTTVSAAIAHINDAVAKGPTETALGLDTPVYFAASVRNGVIAALTAQGWQKTGSYFPTQGRGAPQIVLEYEKDGKTLHIEKTWSPFYAAQVVDKVTRKGFRSSRFKPVHPTKREVDGEIQALMKLPRATLISVLGDEEDSEREQLKTQTTYQLALAAWENGWRSEHGKLVQAGVYR